MPGAGVEVKVIDCPRWSIKFGSGPSLISIQEAAFAFACKFSLYRCAFLLLFGIQNMPWLGHMPLLCQRDFSGFWGLGRELSIFSFLVEKKRARQTDAIKLAHKNKGCQRAATRDSKSDSCFGKCTLIKLNCSPLLFLANFLMPHLSLVLRVRSIEA